MKMISTGNHFLLSMFMMAAAVLAGFFLPYSNAFHIATPISSSVSPILSAKTLAAVRFPYDGFTNLILSNEETALTTMDNDEATAFSDPINFLDGPILTMFGVFGVVMVALVGLKLLTDQMDSAIEQVVVDFEKTLQKDYPKRYQKDIRPLLEGISSQEDRQQKLIQIMENLERTDPEFMNRVQAKMKRK